MVASTKISRQPPIPNIEEYTLYFVIENDIGLTSITDTQMIPIPSIAGEGGIDDETSVLDIGFDFSFDKQIYRQIHVNTNGWLTIDQKDESSWNEGIFFSDLNYRNDTIRMNMNTDHVLLAPWFDDLRNVYDRKNSADPAGNPGNPTAEMSTEASTKLSYGLWRPLQVYRPIEAGVRYYRDNSSQLGKRLIVRWTSLTNYVNNNATSIIRFEVVLYENGRIEYRYAPRNNISLVPSLTNQEDATIGIFGNVPTKNRYRDFSIALGSFTERSKYYKGGTIFDSTFYDTSRVSFGKEATNYVSSLNPILHWPGQLKQGAMFVFQPPTLRRKILPRKFIKDLDHISRYPKLLRTGDKNRWKPEFQQFDDRRTINITTGSTSIINYPTKLSREFGGNKLETQVRRDLYESGIEASGSTCGAFDIFQLGHSIEDLKSISPFNEDSSTIFNNDELNFFTTGSNPNEIDHFDQPIWSKTQLNLNFPINYTTKLLENTSSILYYNSKFNQFYVKGVEFEYNTSSGEVISQIKSDNCDVRETYTNKFASPEDYRGFGPFGNLIVSGTNDIISGTSIQAAGQTNENINALLNGRSYTNALSTEYDKSICNNEDYNADLYETFVLPIAQPFLIEKAIIEFPIEAGPAWFRDKTRLFQPLDEYENQFSTSVDAGGPAITVSLFHQFNFGNISKRDLILSATFTHTYDSGTIVFESSSLQQNIAQMYQEGFEPLAGPPSAYITPNNNDLFSGSVRMLTKAQISNGIYSTLRQHLFTTSSAENKSSIREFLKKDTIKIKNNSDCNGTTITGSIFRNNWINNFGRSQTGFAPSGQSIFGKEYKSISNLNTIDNKFYFSGAIQPDFETTIDSNDEFVITHPVNKLAYSDSPYLVYPDQKLILAISKARPRVYSNDTISTDPDYYFNGDSHDIKIPSGSNVKITLFGSLIQENKEYHDTLNQPLDSEAIHEVIANDPILDQFEVVDRRMLSGTYDDGFMTGTLLSIKPKFANSNVFETGIRQVAFSRTMATKDRNFEILNNRKSISYTEQYEVANSLRNIRHTTDDEIYWDSLVPDPRAIADRNGSSIGIESSDWWNDSLGVWVWNFRNYYSDISDLRWAWSFPFEPHYNNIQRLDDITSAYKVKYKIDLNAGTTTPIDTYVPVNGITIWAGGLWQYSYTKPKVDNYGRWFIDGIVNNTNILKALSNEDVLQLIYGFGDKNTYTGAAADIAAGYKRPDLNYVSTPPTGSNKVSGHNKSPSGIDGYDYADVSSFHPKICGWKYGLISGIPTKSSAVFRRNKFGQFRDMLEQRPYAKYYGAIKGIKQSSGLSVDLPRFSKIKDKKISSKFPRPGPVYVRFINPTTGKLTDPINTQSSNLHFEVTSSLPYIDGIATNRPDTI